MTDMCIDPERYQPDPYWRSLGIDSLEQVRHESLWRAAEEGIPSAHTESCAACMALYESFLRLRAIAIPSDPAAPICVASCPDAPTLAKYQTGEISGHDLEAVGSHLKICPACREDLAFLARSLEPRERLISMRGRSILMAVAAAALIAAIIPWRSGSGTPSEPKLEFTPSSKWVHLAQMPEINRAEMLDESPQDHHSRLIQVLDAYQKGDYATAEKYAGIMTGVVNDSSAEYLLAMARYKQNKVQEGYKAMLVAEKIEPLSAARCWATLQYALLEGDKKTVLREAGHIGGEEAYGPKCKDILSKI